MSTFTHDKKTRILTMSLPKEIPSRNKVRNDFSLLDKDETGESRFHINNEQTIPVALLKMDFQKTQFMSRGAADEIIVQIKNLTCWIEFHNLSSDLRIMMQVVLKKHSVNNLNLK